MQVQAISISQYDNHPFKKFSGGYRTKANPFIIKTKQDLYDLAEVINFKGLKKTNGYCKYKYTDYNTSEYYYATAYYKVMADIDLGGDDFIPIGREHITETVEADGSISYKADEANSYPFEGYFDGNGHTISNFKINLTIDGLFDGCALFGYVDDHLRGMASESNQRGQIMNLTVKDAYIHSISTGDKGHHSYGTAAIVGILSGKYADVKNCTVDHCTIIAEHNGSAEYDHKAIGVGGIVGDILHNLDDGTFLGEVESCISTNNIIQGDEYVGTVIGKCAVYNSQNCSSSGNYINGVLEGSRVGVEQSQLLLNCGSWNFIGQFGSKFNALNAQIGKNSTTQNDIAVLKWNYTTNNWNGEYEYGNNNTESGMGYMAYIFKTTPCTYNEDGTVKEYGQTLTNDNTYINASYLTEGSVNIAKTNNAQANSQTENGTDQQAPYRWFALCNPFNTYLPISSVIGTLTTTEEDGNTITTRTNNSITGDIQGLGVYTWGNDAWNYIPSTHTITIGTDGVGSNLTPAEIASKYLENNVIEPGQGFMIMGSSQGTSASITGALNYPSNQDSKKKSLSATVNKNIQFAVQTNNSTKFLFANPNGLSDSLDAFDSYFMYSNNQNIVEPYFDVFGNRIVHNMFKSLPYTCPVNFYAMQDMDVNFYLVNSPEDLTITVTDLLTNTTYDLSNGEVMSFTAISGQNDNRFEVNFIKKSNSICDTKIPANNINIQNNNRQITITGNDLKQIEIINQLGQTVLKQTINGNNHQTVFDGKQGIYIIKVNNQHSQKTKTVLFN